MTNTPETNDARRQPSMPRRSRYEAREAVATLTRSDSWAWEGATLYVGYRSIRAPNDQYWAIAVEGERLLFATYLGYSGDFTETDPYVGSISLRRDDVVIVDGEVAILHEMLEHWKAGLLPVLLVLTRDGVVRGRIERGLHRPEAPRREGSRLRVRCEADHHHPETEVYVELGRARPPDDPFAATALAHGYMLTEPLAIDSRCVASRAMDVARGEPVTLLALPRMGDAERDAVFAAWGERVDAPLPGVLAARGWLAPVDPRDATLLVLDALPYGCLHKKVGPGYPLYTWDARGVTDAVGAALEHAHRSGRVHGFLWPDRVWTGLGDVRLLDVGLERALATTIAGDDDPERSAFTGTPWAWAAPEVLSGGHGDARSDVWSFALLVFWTRTGVHYWLPSRASDDVASLARQILLDALPSASERAQALGRANTLGHEFDEWFRLCVARDPRDRFADLADARAALPW